jgi:hypothetical protein
MASSKLKTFTKKRPPFFWWILAHALAICFATLSWILSLSIFNNPQIPSNYRMLERIGLAPKPLCFDILEVPAGETLSPDSIYKKYQWMMDDTHKKTLKELNITLKRAYIDNYSEKKPIYVEGLYSVMQVRPLTKDDFFHPGVAVRLQSMVKPSDNSALMGSYPVIIEYMIPNTEKAAFSWFKPGDEIPIRQIPHCASIINVSHIGTVKEPVINLTVVPIARGGLSIGANTVETTSPENINPAARFPLFVNASKP